MSGKLRGDEMVPQHQLKVYGQKTSNYVPKFLDCHKSLPDNSLNSTLIKHSDNNKGHVQLLGRQTRMY